MTSLQDGNRGIARTVFSRALHSFFLMTRGLTLGVRAIVQCDDGKFLLVRHTYTPGWHFPGGGVEKGETIEHALSKELRQETGLDLTGKPSFHGVFFNSGVSKRDHILVYLCQATGSIPSKPSSMEIAEVGYFGLDDLPDGVESGTLRRMQEIVEGATQSATW
ncbi:NUDIX domain-containing protein [Celeribacter marinus]|nr:NUDIX domain-containing protein [Celeribacter marinus]SFL01885.1 ADP-ribose pyrophosphatase YjhB, NUDIX family [Celeribacter marinus]